MNNSVEFFKSPELTDTTALRYILFLIDSKCKEHDGKIFSSFIEAKEYAQDCIEEQYCNKAVIGSFILDPNKPQMLIQKVETIGFAGDKKNANQLNLFRKHQ